MEQEETENIQVKNLRQAGGKLAKTAPHAEQLPVFMSKESELQTEQVPLNLSQNVKPQTEQEPGTLVQEIKAQTEQVLSTLPQENDPQMKQVHVSPPQENDPQMKQVHVSPPQENDPQMKQVHVSPPQETEPQHALEQVSVILAQESDPQTEQAQGLPRQETEDIRQISVTLEQKSEPQSEHAQHASRKEIEPQMEHVQGVPTQETMPQTLQLQCVSRKETVPQAEQGQFVPKQVPVTLVQEIAPKTEQFLETLAQETELQAEEVPVTIEQDTGPQTEQIQDVPGEEIMPQTEQVQSVSRQGTGGTSQKAVTFFRTQELKTVIERTKHERSFSVLRFEDQYINTLLEMVMRNLNKIQENYEMTDSRSIEIYLRRQRARRSRIQYLPPRDEVPPSAKPDCSDQRSTNIRSLHPNIRSPNPMTLKTSCRSQVSRACPRLDATANRGNVQPFSVEELSRNLEQLLLASRERKLCRVCRWKPRCMLLLPCRHFILCLPCLQNIVQGDCRCPQCWRHIESYMNCPMPLLLYES